MTEYKELAARLRHRASIAEDEFVSDFTKNAALDTEAASAIEALEAERDEALADEQKWFERATYEVGAVPHFWDDRARAAEARCRRLEEALRDIIAKDDDYLATLKRGVEKDPVTLACDRARLALQENTP